jgi:hypothetical protein
MVVAKYSEREAKSGKERQDAENNGRKTELKCCFTKPGCEQFDHRIIER